MSDPILLTSEQGNIGIVTLNMAHKRNALNEDAIAAIDAYFSAVPSHIRTILLTAKGDHFCAGLDLKEHHDKARSGVEFMRVCQGWHRAFDKIQHGGIPVIACLQGAVVGGGLELASACHIRVADASTFYALPEGSRGIFVGGGGSVRIPRLIGVARMTDMMMTGRVYNAEDGERVGFAQYLVPEGAALDKAVELAQRIATNAPLTNYALMHALPRIADQPADHGYFTEALMAGIAQDAPEAKARVRAFLEGKAAKVAKS